MGRNFLILSAFASAILVACPVAASERIHVVIKNDLGEFGPYEITAFTIVVDYSSETMGPAASTKVYVDDIPMQNSQSDIELYLSNLDRSLIIGNMTQMVQWRRPGRSLCEIRKHIVNPVKSKEPPYYGDFELRLSDFSFSNCGG